MQTFELDGRRIAVNRAADPAAPVVYLNAYAESEAQAVLDALNALEAPEVTLVVASGFDWNNEMSPWAIDAIAKHMGPMKGEADKTLDWIMKRLVPAIETDGDGRFEPRWRAIRLRAFLRFMPPRAWMLFPSLAQCRALFGIQTLPSTLPRMRSRPLWRQSISH